METSSKTFKIAAVAVAAVVIIAAAAVMLWPKGGESGAVSFYFFDNFDNDGFVAVDPVEGYADGTVPSDLVVGGIWVKGTGSTMVDALKSACKTFGISVTVADGGYINEINGIMDGNLSVQFWNDSSWIISTGSGDAKVDLTLANAGTGTYKYVAVGHGAWSEAMLTPPSPGTTPSEIDWYYGESKAAGQGKEVCFRLFDNFGNSTYTASATYPSDWKTLLVDGLWVRGYGDTMADAFENACERAGIDCTLSAQKWIGKLGEVEDGWIAQEFWNGSSWITTDATGGYISLDNASVDTYRYVAVGHGYTAMDQVLDVGTMPVTDLWAL